MTRHRLKRKSKPENPNERDNRRVVASLPALEGKIQGASACRSAGSFEAQAGWMENTQMQDQQRHQFINLVGNVQGNRHLQRMIAALWRAGSAGGRSGDSLPEPSVVQRQTAAPEQERLSHAWEIPQENPRITKVNHADGLRKARLEDLFKLYLYANENESYMALPTGVAYTKEWVAGEGAGIIQHAIRSKLELKRWKGLKEHFEWYLTAIETMPGDEKKKAWLHDTVKIRLEPVKENVFSPEKAAAFKKKYKKEVRPLPGGGCMTAVYKGLESLYSPEESAQVKEEVIETAKKRGKGIAKRKRIKDPEKIKEIQQDQNSVDVIFDTLAKYSKAGPKITLEYKKRQKKWEPGLEKTVLSMVNPEFPGWYFFGLSVSGGIHSVILVVDSLTSSSPTIYWMDQYTRGFTKNITGKLDKKLEDYESLSYGFSDTRLWPLIPGPDAVAEVK